MCYLNFNPLKFVAISIFMKIKCIQHYIKHFGTFECPKIEKHVYCCPSGTRERHWAHFWEPGNTAGSTYEDKGTCEGTLMGTTGCALRDMSIGESWIWEQLIMILNASMHASITCIMRTSYIEYR